MSDASIHLAFGPVQDFLAEARRTRDLWAGSYLLSYLAASALVGAERAGGVILLPAVDGNALVGALRNGSVPLAPHNRIGSVPHVAELRAPAERAAAVARAAVAAWQAAWGCVSAAACEELRERCPVWTSATEAIWQRQVEHLWSASWVVGDPADMARRKTLRAFLWPDETGEMCTCCGTRAALRGDDGSRQGVRRFWAEVASLHDRTLLTDGRERLCAVCAVKRFYPLTSGRSLGWPVPTAYPSTTTMASLPWRLLVLQRAADEPSGIDAGRAFDLRYAVIDHCDQLKKYAERANVGALTDFDGLAAAAASWGKDRDSADAFLAYDGDWFSLDEIRAKRDELGPDATSALLGSLRALHAAAARAEIGAPGTRYALLAMDGDHMGKLLRAHPADKQVISSALDAFSRRVREIVESPTAHGRLLYAGGDDVLALLPSTTALKTAYCLREAYLGAFRAHLPAAFGGDTAPSISAGLVYAHTHAPLRQVVQTARDLLEDDAKEQAERDAIGGAVWQRSGVTVRVAWKWDAVPSERLAAFVTGVQDGVYGRGFLYDVLPLLENTAHLAAEDEVALLAAEYRASRDRLATAQEVSARAQALQQLARAPRTEGRLVRLALALASKED